MTTYNTGSPIGSTSPKDLYDNAENLDVLLLDQEKLSHPDRLGVPRWTWHGMEERFADLMASSGFQFLADYAPTAGIEVTEYNQLLRDSTGNLWRLDPSVPLPYTTDGSGMPEGGAFLSAGDASALSELNQFKADLADPLQGGDLVHVDTDSGQESLNSALNNRVKELRASLTFSIPTDYPDWQSAIDDLSPRYRPSNGVVIDLVGEQGWQPETGVFVSNGDFGHFRLSHQDPLVVLSPSFPATDIILGENSRMPVLNCLINANGRGLDGYSAQKASIGFVNPGCGITRCQQQGCYSRGGSLIFADGSIFTYASQAGTGYSGYLAWGGIIQAEGGDSSNSGYYGAQGAAGGFLNFRSGISNDCVLIGIRATNGGTVNARATQARRAGSVGYRARESGTLHAQGGDCTGSLSDGVGCLSNSFIDFSAGVGDAVNRVILATNGGQVLADSSTTTAGSISALDGGTINSLGGSFTNTGGFSLYASDGSEINIRSGYVEGGNGSQSIQSNRGSRINLRNTDTVTTGASSFLATCSFSSLNIFNGTHTYPNDAVDLVGGAFLNLDGSGIPAADVPGMANATLSGRGIMWGAS